MWSSGLLFQYAEHTKTKAIVYIHESRFFLLQMYDVRRLSAFWEMLNAQADGENKAIRRCIHWT